MGEQTANKVMEKTADMQREEWKSFVSQSQYNLEDFIRERFGVQFGYSKSQQQILLKQKSEVVAFADSPFGAVTKIVQFKLKKIIGGQLGINFVNTPTIRILRGYAEEAFNLFTDEDFVRDIHAYCDKIEFAKYVAMSRYEKWDWVSTKMAEVLLGLDNPQHNLTEIEIVDFGPWSLDEVKQLRTDYVVRVADCSALKILELKLFAKAQGKPFRKFQHGGQAYCYFSDMDFISVWKCCVPSIPNVQFLNFEEYEKLKTLSSLTPLDESLMGRFKWYRARTTMLGVSDLQQKHDILYGSAEGAEWFVSSLSNRKQKQIASVLSRGMHIDVVVQKLIEWFRIQGCNLNHAKIESLALARISAMNLQFVDEVLLI